MVNISKKNKLDKALEFYEKVLEETPENLAVIKTVAKLYFQTKQYNQAVDFTTDQLELFPTQLELYLVYGTSNGFKRMESGFRDARNRSRLYF